MNVNCLNTKRFFLEYSVRNSVLQKCSNGTNEFFSNKGNKCEETCATMVQKGPYRGKGKGRHRICVGTFMGSP